MSKTTLRPQPADSSPLAPPWTVESWLNHSGQLTLDQLRGRVVVLHAFQMLCPGCVAHGIPQAQRVRGAFAESEVAVIGLHTVFEHHEAMRPVSLRAFLHEYRVDFPVGIDAPGSDSPIPRTMQAYGMRGTPTLILIDRAGRVRLHAFGRPEDMVVGAAIATLVAEGSQELATAAADDGMQGGAACDADGCKP
ncbi:MAG: redoxin domain-containing protein [Polyangiaceae bacterium]|nr:redoxin domain-containing protein [Polyangiaceae bacterium]